MVLVDVDAKPRLALNEACEPKYVFSDIIMQPMAASLIAIGISYGIYILYRMSSVTKTTFIQSYATHAVLSQLMYHVTHFYIHSFVDMSHEEMQQQFNPILVFHFAHQASTLGAFYFESWLKGAVLPFCTVMGVWHFTGMIYPTVWVYLLLVAFFRSKLGIVVVASSFLTMMITGMEVKLCHVDAIRSATAYSMEDFPWHVLGDGGQILTVYLQCVGLLNYTSGRSAYNSKGRTNM